MKGDGGAEGSVDPRSGGFMPRLVAQFERLIIFLFILLFADVLWGVISRYVLGRQSPWTEELAINLLLWVSLLGAALTYRERGHLGVDYFTEKLSPAAKKLAAISADVAVLVFGGFALIYGGGMLVAQTLVANQTSAAMGWKVGYFYSAVPLSGVFFVVFAIEHLVVLFRTSALPPETKAQVQ